MPGRPIGAILRPGSLRAGPGPGGIKPDFGEDLKYLNIQTLLNYLLNLFYALALDPQVDLSYNRSRKSNILSTTSTDNVVDSVLSFSQITGPIASQRCRL